MRVSHTLDEDQMQMVSDAMLRTNKALVEIEDRSWMLEQYMTEASVTQKRMNTAARDVAETIESLTSLINAKGDGAQEVWSDLAKEARGHSSRLLDAVGKLSLTSLSSKVPQELLPLTRPIILFLLILTSSNLFFGFLLCTDDVRTTEFIQGAEFGYWVDLVAWMHVGIFVFLITWNLYEHIKTKKQRARKTLLRRPSMSTVSILKSIARQPFRDFASMREGFFVRKSQNRQRRRSQSVTSSHSIRSTTIATSPLRFNSEYPDQSPRHVGDREIFDDVHFSESISSSDETDDSDIGGIMSPPTTPTGSRPRVTIVG